MNGFRRESVEPRDLTTNQGIVESALDELMYRPRFGPRALEPFGGAVVGNVGASAYLALPNAGNPGGRMTLLTPPAFWVNGTINLRVIWGGSIASANTVNWMFNYTTATVNAAPVAGTGPSVFFAGPGVINGHNDNTFTTAPIPINSSHLAIGISLFINAGAGTYVGEVRLFGFQVIYTPAGGH